MVWLCKTKKAKLRYMDTDSFIVYKKNRWYIAEDIETKFDTSNYELGR